MATATNIGQMKHRITFYSRDFLADNSGFNTAERESVLETWARITPIQGQQITNAGQLLNVKTYQILMRLNPEVSINESHVGVYNGRTLIIHSVIDRDEEHRTLALLAYEQSE